MRAALIAIAAFALAACGEKPQTNRADHDTALYKGTGTPFVAPGWKQGDRNSWEQQLKTRAQMGQNDYVKVN
ncbi:hypothetical protein [Ramlibacter humi]